MKITGLFFTKVKTPSHKKDLFLVVATFLCSTDKIDEIFLRAPVYVVERHAKSNPIIILWESENAHYDFFPIFNPVLTLDDSDNSNATQHAGVILTQNNCHLKNSFKIHF